MSYKLTCELPDEFREKVRFLCERLNLNTAQLIANLIDKAFKPSYNDRLDKLELRIEELASRIAWIEKEINDLKAGKQI